MLSQDLSALLHSMGLFYNLNNYVYFLITFS